MPIASEVEPVASGIFLWRVYDAAAKADLFSTAIASAEASYLVDPVPLTAEAMAQLHARSPIGGIVVTNENHTRATARYAETFQVPVLAHPALVTLAALPRIEPIQDRGLFVPGLTAIEIDGGPTGEIAIYSDRDGGSMIIGDALINFEPYGFALLPAKYCSNARIMRRSLPKLLDYDFERMLFAHGMPILEGARHRLEELLRHP